MPDAASESDYILLMTKDQLTRDQNQELKELGVEVHTLLGGCIYLCRYDPKNLDAICAKPYVERVNNYRPPSRI